MGNEENGVPRDLKIRSRQVYAACEDPIIALGVQCPKKARDVDLEDCLRCSAFRELRLDEGEQHLAVACDAGSLLDGGVEPTTPEVKKSAQEATVGSIMTTDVLCVSSELSIGALATLFLDRGISGAPVVDEFGRAIGMVSKTDLVRYYSDETMNAVAAVVGDIMMPMALCLPANESIAKAAALMAFEGMHRVPVANTRGQIVGLVSSLDVLRWMAREHGYILGNGSRASVA
jgi:CBS domain-containing protein